LEWPVPGAKVSNGVDMCPVIKGVNEEEVQQIQQQKQEEEEELKSNETTTTTTTEKDGVLSDAFDFDSEFANEIPSVASYKKMRSIMQLITGFYRKGTETKRMQYESLEEDVKKVSFDIYQSEEQLKALKAEENIKFRGHLKWKEYVQELEEEIQRLEKEKLEIVIKRDHYHKLSEWSKTIVQICEWLEYNLDDFALRNIAELPENLKKEANESLKHLKSLSDEEVEQYSKGLDEITHNLNESRDFFEASVDGRMNQYQKLHAEIIQCQLRILERFPKENNPRRDYIEANLQEDLEFIERQLRDAETSATKNRRERMLKMHKDFLQVLKFFTEKLHVLKLDPSKRTYDPQFTDLFTA
jgi:hypothetical protein